MRFVLERTVEPEIEPLTLAQIKNHLRGFASVTADDDAMTSLIKGAREWAEDYTGRACIDQTWRLSIDGTQLYGDTVSGSSMPPFGCGLAGAGRYEWFGVRRAEIYLHKSPILAVSSFASIDTAGVETEIDPDTYELREPLSKWPRIVPLNGAVWSTGLTNYLRVTFRAGFADRNVSPQDDASVVPERFKQAMKLWAESNYDRDSTMMMKLLEAAERILKGERADLQIA